MNLKKIFLNTFAFAIVLFAIGGVVHAVLLPDMAEQNASIMRKGNHVYLISIAVLFCHGALLSIAYDYLVKNNIKISGIRYAMSFGLATSFINIINQLCWFDLAPFAHTLLAVAYYPISYLVWGCVTSIVYRSAKS